MALKTVAFNVQGMHCTQCERVIERAVGRLPGVDFVKAHYADERVEARFDDAQLRPSALIGAIEQAGYDYSFVSSASPLSHAWVKNAAWFVLLALFPP
jgi:copper chaperone CopZ